ncbi:histidine kinase [Clostridium gelidum]|uniref:histidine kinase n=1 Tax=Clostridium gelidum TaxID=704125 RepID=A0ABN6ITS6_9CLOT|nr:sensor histidine kinase [Clostridium gelidum]BCZ45609.1 histidine kinase [Clostridium gelidum]
MKKTVANFVIDRTSYILFMFINSILIITFYSLTVNDTVEILYPISITIFLMLSYLVIDFIKYSRFNIDIQNSRNERNYNIRCATKEQKEIYSLLKELNLEHIKNENNIVNKYKEKEHFLANSIHKFKNYISVMALIIDKGKSQEVIERDILIDIEKENNNLESSLEQVLSFIRIDSFGNDLELTNVNIVQELKNIINDNKSKFIHNEVFPVFECSENDIYICTDKKWNRIIIEQIITNAIKYTVNNSNRKVYFNIESSNEEVILSIRDNGIGIPEYDLKRVFEAFFTGENGRKIRNSTGIGLFISKEICKKLGHTIEINSKINVGTEVRISYLSKL